MLQRVVRGFPDSLRKITSMYVEKVYVSRVNFWTKEMEIDLRTDLIPSHTVCSIAGALVEGL